LVIINDPVRIAFAGGKLAGNAMYSR
jgi:hypothetical protein